MNAKEAAETLGVSDRQVYALAAPAGPIPCYRIGKRIIFDQSDVLEYRKSCQFTEIKSAVASYSTSRAPLKGKESGLQKAFRALGINPKPMLMTGRNQPSSTQSQQESMA